MTYAGMKRPVTADGYAMHWIKVLYRRYWILQATPAGFSN